MGERLDEGGGTTRDDMWLASTELVCAYAARFPLVFAVEDAQWVDAESLAWLDHLLARTANLRCFCLLTMRPTFWRDQRNRFTGRDHVRIELKPLAQRSVRSIASAILGPRATAEDANRMVEAMVSQAAGSPLFAEELARLAALGRDMASAPTIEAAIQVQLDALDDHARDVAARLSIFGFSGWDAGLRALGIESATESLRSLAAAEIVVEQASSRFPGTREFSFKHALTREVAYASLGEDQLKELHERAAEWLAEVADDDAVIARHFELGGKLKLGAHHLERAARHALAANALAQAAEFAERALAFAGDKPTSFARALILDEAWARLDARATERENAIRELQGAVYDTPSEVRAEGARARYEDARGGGPETTARLEEVLQRARTSSLVDEEASCAAALAARCAFAGELSRAEATCTELLKLASRHGIASAAADAWQTLAVVRQARGEVGSALEARREAVLAAHEGRLLTREATLMINVGFALTTVGARDEARESIMAGISLAEATGSPGVVRHGQMNLLCWAATFGGEPDLDVHLEKPRRVADDASHGTWVPHDRATLGVLFYRGVELLRAR
ncbi:MAG: serine/threonine-protein kinase PknK, partial [Myxococcales bacterium]|nr:serine/threonine-protein kinase PknK [Myxococcales bacterium]